ncbi:RNA 3'-terminal phosphate cyclase [Hippocampus comes]|uniref:RNA 3'-terminal phosphate cyclase n=1 Tax=Hippocampus comes TaxID=109280 RepID=A0A3Q2Z8P5_HIPCM|nr:PREDICTED: RNA 3'-terminal phosphate cyclase [Hippocampus comes]
MSTKKRRQRLRTRKRRFRQRSGKVETTKNKQAELQVGAKMESPAVELDGSFMEGGGQILRVAAALSCIGGSSVTITKVRAGRSTPGLRPQHLSGLQLVSDMCAGVLQGGAIGSTDVSLTPGKIRAGNYTADTHTAGSVCLLLQVALPCALYGDAPSILCLRGGTNADMAPQIDYTLQVFKPIVEKFGVLFDCDIQMRGFYPKGGGEVTATVPAVKELRAVTLLERGAIAKIHGRAYVAAVLPFKLAKDMAAAAVRAIRREVKELHVNIQAVQEKEAACGNASGIIIVAESSTGCLFAGSALGKKGAHADRTGTEAAEMLLRNLRHGGCVDEFLQDQLIVFMALAKGTSRIRTGAVTCHTQTAIHVAQRMTRAKFTITKCVDTPNVTHIIQCLGSGVPNPNLDTSA